MDLIKDIFNDCHRLINKDINTLSYHVMVLEQFDISVFLRTQTVTHNNDNICRAKLKNENGMEYDYYYQTRIDYKWFFRNLVKKIRLLPSKNDRLALKHQSIFPIEDNITAIKYLELILRNKLTNVFYLIKNSDYNEFTEYFFILATANPYHNLSKQQQTKCIKKLYDIMTKNRISIANIIDDLNIESLNNLFNDIINAPLEEKLKLLGKLQFINI